MRCQRVRMSISVCSSMCPICSEPVTFGGGITIENTGPGAFESALNSASFTQKSAQRGSICCGSYAFAISRAIRCDSPFGDASARPSRPLRFFMGTGLAPPSGSVRFFVGAGLGPSVLDELESFKVIFDYTRAKAAASIRRSSKQHSILICTKREGSLQLQGQGITTSSTSTLLGPSLPLPVLGFLG